ncbi:phosphate acyltransferase [Salidesulfovibrio brasiliensis]|uniref:phosphate acyltransferase n=1 Tax=Salidesulfovibrio brasiliensis TaxID=221711 RepID=UPI0009FADADA|nr:phosphate acyltransferase [Salidesulfovibrio brasiliensis]
MREMTSLADIVRAVRESGSPPKVAVARSAEGFVLEAAVQAHEAGIAEPILVGDAEATRSVAKTLGLDISDLEIIPIRSDDEAVFEAVRLFREGRAELIMKGLVSTATLLKAVLNKETGVPPKAGILSHVTVFDSPVGGLTLLTDAGVNIKPTLQRKVDILKNALDVARRLGLSQPRCALLAATEKVNYPAMPATMEADVIARMAEQGEFGDALVAGPLSLDLALSPDSARCKGVDGPVAGCANVLLTPDIESGNVLYKALATLCRTPLASVVVGSRVPVVVPSRADTPDSKFNSMALAAYLSRTETP